jgi:Leucine-rich repeat (LRR) protein
MPFDIEKYINSLPLDTELIDVSNKRLTYIPDLSKFSKLKVLCCSYNNLTKLPPLNDSLESLRCEFNKLTQLPNLNNNLESLYCYNNELTELPKLNNKLIIIDCSDNLLSELPPLNSRLVVLFLENNNIFHKKYNDFEIFNVKNILYNFKFTFYSIKFKSQFKKWLWEKVREPKIMQKFHPDYLNTLKETDDLEEFLEDWIK